MTRKSDCILAIVGVCRVRLGLILEDVDGFAGDIAHRHVNDDSVRHVTASVDKITWFQPPPEGERAITRWHATLPEEHNKSEALR